MNEKLEPVIGCVPCLDAIKMEFVPYKGSTVGECSRCELEVWLGPEQKKQQEAHGYPIVCLRCLVEEHGPKAMDLMQPLTEKRMGE